MRRLTIAAALAIATGGMLALPERATAADPATAPQAKTPAALVLKECGACHIAYLPRFLPTAAWEHVFDHLDSHFGENAQIPPEERTVIRRYYTDRAAWGSWSPTPEQPMPRITALPWWKRAMGDLDFKKPKIKSKANCGACHTHADWYMAVRE